jgi:8-hydroxy-5-deazaflavin:NADPH oxidoreductase
MRMGMLGTGMVGQTLASRLVELGHDVVMGSRTADNPKALSWAKRHGESAHSGTFADAAAHAPILWNATAGSGSLAALEAAGPSNLSGKVLVDVCNPLDHSGGAPSVVASSTSSIGEQIQRAHPELRVVKALNTVNCRVMVDPSRVPGTHDVFVAGNDSEAKAVVEALLHEFGWVGDRIVDAGDITAARGLEMYLQLWITLAGVFGSTDFNVRVARPPSP